GSTTGPARVRARSCGRGLAATRRSGSPRASGTAARARAGPSIADRTRWRGAGSSLRRTPGPGTLPGAAARSPAHRAAPANARPPTRARESYDFEVALQFPIRHRVKPLPPFPLPCRCKVIDELVAEPIAGELRVAEVARRFDQRA